MINIKTLTEKDVGRWVVYDDIGNKEFGRLKSWNDHFIFVVYKCADQWNEYQNYTGQCTFPDDVRFVEEGEKIDVEIRG